MLIWAKAMTQATSRRTAAICGALLVLTIANVAHAQSAQVVAKKSFAATVLLVMEDENGQPLAFGSGFFVRGGEIVSNLHVVEGAASGYAKLVGQKIKYDIQGVTAVDSEHDLVLLRVQTTGPQPLPLGDSEAVQVGETVYAVGNPQGLEGTFSQGIISAIRTSETDRLLQVTAPISPGSSGGPVLNGSGEVIGVSVATYSGGQNLNFAIPSKYLKLLLGIAGTVRPLAQMPSRSQGSLLADLGDHGAEGAVASAFAWNDNQYMGYYTFSVRNNLRESIQDVVCLVIFYGRDGLPIETEISVIEGPIGGNLARRSEKLGRLSADEVRDLTARTEMRILDFRLFKVSRRR